MDDALEWLFVILIGGGLALLALAPGPYTGGRPFIVMMLVGVCVNVFLAVRG